MPGIIGQWVCFQENSLPRHTIQKPWWKVSDDHTYLRKRKTKKNMLLYILCAYFRHPKKKNNPELRTIQSPITARQSLSGKQRRSLLLCPTILTQAGAVIGRKIVWQWQLVWVSGKRGIITQLTHVRRASPVLGALARAEAFSPLPTPRWQLC